MKTTSFCGKLTATQSMKCAISTERLGRSIPTRAARAWNSGIHFRTIAPRTHGHIATIRRHRSGRHIRFQRPQCGRGGSPIPVNASFRNCGLAFSMTGEVLIDDVSVVADPLGEATPLIQNGSFSNGPEHWRMLGTHLTSRVEEDGGNAVMSGDSHWAVELHEQSPGNESQRRRRLKDSTPLTGTPTTRSRCGLSGSADPPSCTPSSTTTR